MSDQDYPRFGPYVKNLRLEKRISLRDFAIKTGMDVGYLSRVERGKVTPPQHPDAIKTIAEALEIESGCHQWEKMVDYAAVDNSNVPDDLMIRKPVTDILPFCFAKFRHMSDDQFQKFVQKLQES